MNAGEFITAEIEKFRTRWGVDPAGLLLHPLTLKHLIQESKTTHDPNAEIIVGGGGLPTVLGAKVYTSEDVRILEVRFVI